MAGEFYGPLGTLNGASTHVATLTGAGTKTATLVVGATYRIQATGGVGAVGFGSTTAAAQTDADTGGETLGSSTPPQVFVIVNETVQCIACTAASTNIIIRRTAAS